MQKEIYLDNSATTKPFDEVIDYMVHINKNIYGNPSSLHRKGIEAEKLIKKARGIIADSLEVDSGEIYFTSGGTESNNLAIRGYLLANPRKGKHILTTKTEHPSVLEVYKNLEDNGYNVDYIGVDRNGTVDLQCLRNKLDNDTSLISIIYVNNETGCIQPLSEILRIKNQINRNAVIHVDAVQAYGKLKILPRPTCMDMISVSSHKIHGPKGAGAVYINKNIKVKPVILGGGQEYSIRSGTENVAGICGFGLAAEKSCSFMEKTRAHVGTLKRIFIEKLYSAVEGFKINSPENSSPYILNISFLNLRGEVLLHHLEERNIFISTGAACSSRKNLHSHVLKAMGLESREIEGAVRFSFSEFNDEDDIEYTIGAIKEIIPRIRY